MEAIVSTENPYIKHLTKLQKDSHYRIEQQSLLLEGAQLISEILPYITTGTVLAARPFDTKLPQIHISNTVSKKLSSFNNEDEVFLETSIPQLKLPSNLNRLLVLDRVSDPGNLGTLLRTALALSWSGVFFLPGCCDPFNEKVIRASKGALFRLPHIKGTFEDLDLLVAKHKLTPLAADLSGDLPEKDIPSKLMLILGNEGQGLSAASHKRCRLIALPMNKGVESLNVSVAGGILMYILRDYAKI